MRPPLPAFAVVCAFLCATVSSLMAADAKTSASGYWEGTVALPNRELEIRLELNVDDASAPKGTIDIPMQGLRGFPLTSLKVAGQSVEFSLGGIPGEPRFTGTLASDGQSIAGDFYQGSGTTTFRVERKTKPATKPDTFVQPGIAGKGLPGIWRGVLRPMAGIELRLALEVAAANGGLEGAVISLDQGEARIPIANVTEKEGAVRFETPRVNGTFEGKLNADGSELTGTWTQMNRDTPLVFRRSTTAKP